MAINVVCPGCDKTLKAPDEAAGKQARCPHCRTSIQVPSAPAEEDAGYTLLEPPPPRPSFIKVEPSPPRRDPAAEPRGERVAKKKPKRPDDGEASGLNPFDASRKAKVSGDAGEQASVAARKRSPKHWWFSLTLVPLVFSLLGAKEDVLQRVEKTIAAHPEVMDQVDAGEKSGAELFDLLPGGKLEGAHLSRRTWMHWVYALAAAGLFSFLILALFER
ncbi:MAG TPA: hypothetical protein VMV10_19970, partial [Pirellulales bacterium]|nr:hypothetical protein [Pirellulales bacterium]